MFIFDRPFIPVAAGLGMAFMCVWLADLSEPPISKELDMNIRIGTKAPDFEGESTQGHISFHQWIGNSWCVLFWHPKDFTPVSTTELGYMARLEPEFGRRKCKIAGLSVDRVEGHMQWLNDIRLVTRVSADRRPGPQDREAQ